ncbi:hypothetical protein M408DRAFT_135858 [Serendipita vermifera MAFF 305830]|uniref:PHD-type domain-containing protein n=1 Tax=Serendipita vermifera MAFF 305830 TaxID=933852 RepID=A0A0C2W1M0_SERVB|nr:hypothetical protein M408DRAFT_135858 [Serendipita vermifera MAFF 305830]
MLRQENEKVAPDGTQCSCHGQSPIYDGILLIKCGTCHKMFHGGCLYWGSNPQPPEDWQCPICVTKRGKSYRGPEIRVKSPDDHGFGVYVDIKKTIELNRDLVKVQMGEANGPCITLDLLAFYPPEDNQPTMPPPLPGVSMGMPPNMNMALPSAPYFGHPGPFPHMMLSHPIGGQPHRTMVPSPANPANSNQHHGSSHPHTSLPPPPVTTGYPGNWPGDIAALDKKKRKRSVEARPDESKRRKSELSTPVTTPLNGTGVIPGTPVEEPDVIDLTIDESLPHILPLLVRQMPAAQ